MFILLGCWFFYRDAFMRRTKKEWRLQVIIGAPRLGSGVGEQNE